MTGTGSTKAKGATVIPPIKKHVSTRMDCLAAGNITTVTCSKQERRALLNFKYSVKDDSNMLSSWVGNDCCRWERVRCNGVTGYVESLHLSGWDEDNLVGNKVSTALGDLRHLKYLDLSWNSFGGSRIPDFIGSLKQLNYLNLSGSTFSGNIPHHIGNLSNLKVLDLSFNIYPILDDTRWISGLSSLEHLDLSFVDLSGAKNHGMMLLHMFPSLVKLSLSGCRLSNADLGLLLNSSATLANIKHLDLSYNYFHGQVPHILENMTSLQFLDLSYFNLSQVWKSSNPLTMIPSLLELHLSVCSLQEMHLSPAHINLSALVIQHLDLSRNLIKNIFPSILTNMTSLQVLDLSGNYLNTSVPVMPNLLELDLSDNAFKQLEDVGIWRQCHLKQLGLSSNAFLMEFTDSPIIIPECFEYAMERLYLDGSLNGTIPKSLGRFANLRGLDLSRNRLTGPIPQSLGRSRLLQVLDLSDNELTGPIPIFSGKLTKLDLSYNHLNGSIPESIGRIASLKDLFLGGNKLTGSIPPSLGRLVLLEGFAVSANSLNGTIPVSIGQLTNLQTLLVSSNSLEGEVSEAHFANLSMLKKLYLGHNNMLTFNVSCEWMPPFQLIDISLTGCKVAKGFPQWLRSQKRLEVLALSNVSISGPLPTWLRKFPVISTLDLSHNKLSGPLTNLPRITSSLLLQNNFFNESVPRSLCRSTDLEVLNLAKNWLTGKIPNCLGDLQNLKYMILSSNKLSSAIPSSLGQCSALEWLNLNNNSFIGELPQELGNLKALKVLDLGDNEFFGNIPEWIGEKLANLMVFRLHKNNFDRGIPPSLCKSSYLQILDVAHNSLSGCIPLCLGELYGMVWGNRSQYLYPFYDQQMIQVMKGVVLEYTKTLGFLTNLDLSSNKLVGGIPDELTALHGLIGLNLSNNRLGGGIPKDIGKMKQLNSLDFSGNKLTGIIPPSIAALNFLSYLNLSHNNLSGGIPTGNQLQTLEDPSIYAGNDDLCGVPLPKICSTIPKNNYKPVEMSNKAWFFGLDIMSGFATGFFGVIGVLVFKTKSRHKFFMFAEATTDKIFVAGRVSKMKKGR